MASTIAHLGRVDYQSIHFSDRFPVERTPCGCVGPAADRWRFVTCLACLAQAPKDPRIEGRIRELREEARQRESGI